MTHESAGSGHDATAMLGYPEIVEESPAPGDVHPLDKGDVARILRMLPFIHIAGLRRIELRARKGERIGEPFGCYWREEKAIILHSLPEVWRLECMGADFLRSLALADAEIEERQDCVLVTWPEPGSMSLWYYSYVFAHELIHHYLEQYREDDSAPTAEDHVQLAGALHGANYMDVLAKHFAAKKKTIE